MTLLKTTSISKELADESGAGSAFAMLFALICVGIGGLAIDASNVWSVKQRLQAATDVSAHAAAISMVFPGESGLVGTPSEVAIAALLENAPESQFGVALQESDVILGYWDANASQMSASSVDASGNPLLKAVAVTARLDGNVGNVVPTFILKLIGFDYWQVATSSVFVRDTPWCFNGGFIAGGVVDIASNNDFVNGFCMHGNQGVDVNDNVVFGNGVRVSMPNSAPLADGGMLALKGTEYVWADGKDNQIGDQYLEPSLASVEAINAAILELQDVQSPLLPDYIETNNYTNPAHLYEITVTPSSPLTADQLISGAINVIDCPEKGLDFPEGITIENLIIIADCKINFSQDTYVTNAIIATTDTGTQSINSPSSLRLGADDDCTKGGGVTLMTMGDAHFSAQTEWFGAELITNGDAHISATGNGIEGVSVEAAGDIFATSNLGFGLCNSGVDHYRDLYIIRMVY